MRSTRFGAEHAVQSLRWVKNRVQFWRELARRRRERGAFRLISDPMKRLDNWLEQCVIAPPETRFRIVVVQPGLFRSALRQGTAANVLLSSCRNSSEAAAAEFSVFCSSQ